MRLVLTGLGDKPDTYYVLGKDLSPEGMRVALFRSRNGQQHEIIDGGEEQKMLLRRTAEFCALSLILSAAASANPLGPIQLDYIGPAFGNYLNFSGTTQKGQAVGSHQAGVFKHQLVGTQTTILTVCLDALETVNTSAAPHFQEGIGGYTQIPSEAIPPSVPLDTPDAYDDVRKAQLARFYQVAWDDILALGNATTLAARRVSAAFQWGVWEILREGFDTTNDLSSPWTLDITGGDVQITSATADAVAVKSQLGTWFTEMAAGSGGMGGLQVFTPVKLASSTQVKQGFYVTGTDGKYYVRNAGQELLYVPEPGFYGVLALGLSGLWISLRKRRSQA